MTVFSHTRPAMQGFFPSYPALTRASATLSVMPGPDRASVTQSGHDRESVTQSGHDRESVTSSVMPGLTGHP